jgi:putative endonuclease
MRTQRLGNAAEKVAMEYLENKGLKLLEKNFSCRMGEIDLIMTDEDNLVFIEVRLRTNPNYGSGAETVTPSKQRKIIRTAQFYLLNNAIGNRDCRFDVISIDDKIDWIQHAFTLD